MHSKTKLQSQVGKVEGQLIAGVFDQLNPAMALSTVTRQLFDAALPPLCADAEPIPNITSEKYPTHENAWR
jgi:hypothetical protein